MSSQRWVCGYKCVCLVSGSCMCSVPVIFNCHSCFLLCFYVSFPSLRVCVRGGGGFSCLPNSKNIIAMLEMSSQH